MTLIKSISGIRGTIGGEVGEALTPVDIVKYAAAYGTYIKAKKDDAKVIIGRDARVSGPMVSSLVSSTLQGLGIDIVDIQLAPTPTVELAVKDENADGGIIITASHNPGQWNALKLLNADGEFLSAEAGEEVLRIAEEGAFEFATSKKLGSYSVIENYISKHIEKILALAEVDKDAIASRNLRVAIDCVNSVGGIAVPQLLEALGVEQVEKFFCEPDGAFKRNPEPVPENLNHICSKIEQGAFDLGIVVDPDVDRLVLIQDNGAPFGEEYTLVAVADYILGLNNGGNTVSNLSSSQALQDITEKHEGNYTAAAVGEVNVVKAMKATHAVIGGEGNGGVIFPKMHYGRDALTGIALFLSHLAKFGKTMTQLKSTYPQYHISKNKIELTPEIDIDNIMKGIKLKYSNMPVNPIDGIKISFGKEWVHLRRSNTEPIIRIIAESHSQVTADHLANKLISDIREVISERA
ncbi:phosphomannomutase [Catalinimonas alkaloidigena]|uniref:phosphoglucosamine mutase n=1 Tax=Catalinimonas alkaloidigena TaxID=1075417 RepID=UPI002406273C|nr:phosphoglucosamine mutase [Catalinimonas alkaloidigena]MDF9800527.1 phosphomannomutase [Catalinimonas alkaloidigena]